MAQSFAVVVAQRFVLFHIYCFPTTKPIVDDIFKPKRSLEITDTVIESVARTKVVCVCQAEAAAACALEALFFPLPSHHHSTL